MLFGRFALHTLNITGTHLHEDSMPDQRSLLLPEECVVSSSGFSDWARFRRRVFTSPGTAQQCICSWITARAFGVPFISTTSASKVYSGPLLPAIHNTIPALLRWSDAI